LAISRLQECLAISRFQECNVNSIMAVTLVIRCTQAQVMWHLAVSGNGNQQNQRWQSAEIEGGNQPNQMVAISRIKITIKIQLWRSRRK
jgi:hypothetical protein